MSDCLDLQGYSSDGDNAFKSCENLLLEGVVLNKDFNCCPTDEDVTVVDNCKEISMCHDLNCTDHSLHELVDILSNSNSPNQKSNLLELSLDDIPLTETNPSDFIDFLPSNIPGDNLLILPVPEYLQNDDLLNNIMGIELDRAILDEIGEAIKGSEGAVLAKPDENLDNGIKIIQRQPLQLIQQVIKYPAVKNARLSKATKDLKASKRKQLFQFPREDCVEFYSDDENSENPRKLPTINDCEPSPKKQKLEEIIAETPKSAIKKAIKIPDESPKGEMKKRRFVIQKCPRCDKSFKKLSMHKCKDALDAGPIKKLRPSEVPLPQKCDICKAFFGNKENLQKHQMEKHSRLVCKVCKLVMKNIQGLKIHSAKCGIDIQPVNKPTLRNSKNKK